MEFRIVNVYPLRALENFSHGGAVEVGSVEKVEPLPCPL